MTMTRTAHTNSPQVQGVSPRNAAAPRAAAGASAVSVVVAILLIAAGAVALRDAAVAAGWLTGQSWIAAAVDAVDGLSPEQWLLPVGIAVLFAGMTLIGVAVKPRKRTSVPVLADTAVFTGFADIARIATATARDVPGVLDATSTATRRKVVVRCRVTGVDRASIHDQVTESVAAGLQLLGTTPRIVIRLKEEAQP
jgi:hypothetical protein